MDVPLTRAGLARRYGVSRSAVSAALRRAESHPSPLNAGDPIELFNVEEFDAWWSARRAPGRPPTPTPKESA